MLSVAPRSFKEILGREPKEVLITIHFVQLFRHFVYSFIQPVHLGLQ